MNRLITILFAAGMILPIRAEETDHPIIYMHMHAISVTAFGENREFCPGDIRKTFPGIDPSTEFTQQDLEECPNPLLPPESDQALLDQTLRIMEEYDITGVLIGAWFLVPRVLHYVAATRQRDLFVLTVVLVCIGTAWAVSLSGISIALGAFLAGLIVAGSEYRHQAISELIPFRVRTINLGGNILILV